MSHFSVLALIDLPGQYPPVQPDQDVVYAKVAEAMAPYSEELQVEAYDEPCWCKGEAARSAVYKEMGFREVRGEIWAMDALRTVFWALPEYARSDELWEKLIEPRREMEKTLMALRVDQHAPNADCEDCHGTGIRQSTYNPKSKWDGWRIGGRWDGHLFGDEFAQKQRTEGGFNFSDANELAENNMTSVELQLLNQPYIPFALLAPDGWHTKGDMHWFGIVTDAKQSDSWEAEVRSILERYRGHWVVLCDCHI